MLDSLEEAILLLERSRISDDAIDYEQVVDFITGQQIRYGRDAGVFVESRNVSHSKSRVYTGEKLQTHLAAKNILTIESARAIVISNSISQAAHTSIALVDNWLDRQCFSDFCATGECKHSSVAFMRYLNASGRSERVERMLTQLTKYRDGKGGWKGFPYFFTLLALSEINSSLADDELNYTLEFVEMRFRRSRTEEPYNSRRQEILYRVLNRFGQSLLNLV